MLVSFGLLVIPAGFVWVWLGWSCLSFCFVVCFVFGVVTDFVGYM